MTQYPHNTDEKLLSQGPCPDCPSTDAYSVYERHTWCYSCGTRHWTGVTTAEKENTAMTAEVVPIKLPALEHTQVGSLVDRNIDKDTVRKYEVKLTADSGVVTEHWYPYHTNDGELVAYKKRTVKDKQFSSVGNIGAATLFGQKHFTKGGKYITLCEGEIDTMAVFQMNGSKFPVVGVPNAQGAYKACKKNFEWLDSYDSIIISLDSDEPGLKAAKMVASLFPKKSKIVKLKHKDAGQYLAQHEEKTYIQCWWDAEQYKPDDILGGADTMWDIIKQPRAESAFYYPWDKLNKLTYGMRLGEFTIITAGSGTGKTQVLREISHHVLTTSPDCNIGLIYLEETAWETARGLLSIDLDKPTHLPTTHVTDAELQGANGRTWGLTDSGGSHRVVTLGDSWKDNNVSFICDKIKYMAKGLDCKLIILDHISFMVSDNPGDERKMLDEIGHKLKALTIELDIHLLTVAHSRRQSTKPLEEGGTTSLSDLRGTAGLGQLANLVLGVERDGQAEDEKTRNTSLIRILKNRFSGQTGPTSKVYYDQDTGRLTEVEDTEEEIE